MDENLFFIQPNHQLRIPLVRDITIQATEDPHLTGRWPEHLMITNDSTRMVGMFITHDENEVRKLQQTKDLMLRMAEKMDDIWAAMDQMSIRMDRLEEEKK